MKPMLPFLALSALLLTSWPALASWDVYAQDLPAVAKVSQIPEGFQPKPLGTRRHIIERIRQVVPNLRFDADGWASVTGPDTDVEINVGREDPVRSIAFHGRGGAGDVALVDRVLEALGVRALDAQTGEFFSKETAVLSHRQWRAHADRAIQK